MASTHLQSPGAPPSPGSKEGTESRLLWGWMFRDFSDPSQSWGIETPEQPPPRGLPWDFSASQGEGRDACAGLGSVQASPGQRGGER